MSNPFTYNGGSIVAMKGENCIGIACDTRIGEQFKIISREFKKVFKISDKILLGLTGLASDVITFKNICIQNYKLFSIKEGFDMNVEQFGTMIGNLLYEKRFSPYFVSPIVVGLNIENTPILYSYDSIGCITKSENFGS